MPAAHASRGDENAGPAAKRGLAFVGPVDAGQDLDDRRLARAIFSEKRDTRPRCRDTDTIQRPNTGEALRDAGEGEDGIGHEFPLFLRNFDEMAA